MLPHTINYKSGFLNWLRINILGSNMNIPPESELQDFRSYISRFEWRVAKTFENFSQHLYILNFLCWKKKEDKKCNGESETSPLYKFS